MRRLGIGRVLSGLSRRRPRAPLAPRLQRRSAGWVPPAARPAGPDGKGRVSVMGFDASAWRPPAARVVETQADATRLGREHHLTVIVIGYLASVLTLFVVTVVLLALR